VSPKPLPKTLGDLGEDWLLAFHCGACKHLVTPAFYYLKRQWGESMRLVDLLPKLRCQRCAGKGRMTDCSIVIQPEWLRGRQQFWSHRYQLRRGEPWSPFKER